MALDLDRFMQRLVASGIISADDVESVLAGVNRGPAPLDGDELSRLLVESRKLTPYQASQLRSENGKPLVLGNYVILDKLGQGGMGLVFKAEHRRMKRLVALKILSSNLTDNPEALRRFQREVQAAARLEHPNIVTAHDADEANGTHFLVMQYVAGLDLSVLVRRDGPFAIAKAVDCIIQTAGGLEYAHKRGIVHRDIKPANLLLDSAGVVKILDMGLARLDSAGAEQDQLTGTGQIMGTADYMAPEQALDTKSADARADIYSLGVTLWYLLTGRLMYAGDSVYKRMQAHQSEPIPSLRGICPHVPAELELVFNRMVAKSPEDRFQSMHEVVTALKRWQAGFREADLESPNFGNAWSPTEIRQESQSSATPGKSSAAPKAVTQDLANEPTVTYQSAASDTDSHTEQAAGGSRRLPSNRSQKSARGQWAKPVRWAVAVAGVLGLVAELWYFLRPSPEADLNRPDPQQSSIATNGPPNNPLARPAPPIAAGTVVPLIPLLKREHLADGRWEDISIAGNRVSFDVGHKRFQIWHDFRNVVAKEMTLRTRLRIDPQVTGGYAKLVFLNHREPDYFVLLSDIGGTRTLGIVSQTSQSEKPLSPRVPWPAKQGGFVDLAFVMSNNKLQVQFDGKVVCEAANAPRFPCHLAFNVGGWKCDFEQPEVVIHTP